MIIIFNLIILGLVGLIAYWWANEGLFSAFIHMVCVVTAGAIALSLWEPITMSILTGGGFDNYAWGVVLIGVFSISLLILRVAADKIMPSNVNFPTWANFAFGGFSGAVAGVISIGICLIGSGFIQSTNELFGYRGTGRDENNKAMIGKVGDPIWLDVAQITAEFYGTLSVGTLRPDFSGAPLRQYNPSINELATLVRDTFSGGKGQLSLLPDAAKVTSVAKSDDGLVVVQVSFTSQAKDYGGQLSLASSQVRLISEAIGSKKPKVHYPFSWKQEVADGTERIFIYDDVSHYATSVPGRQETEIKFAFDTKDAGFVPKFIQIRGTRLEVPNIETTAIPHTVAKEYRGRQLSDEEIVEARDPLGKDIQHLVDSTSKILRLRISTNGIPGTIVYDEELYFVEGSLTTKWKQRGISAALAIKGIRADEGTGIVQVDVTPGKSASFSDLISILSENDPIELIDTNGRKYAPIGYYLGDSKRMQLTLTPSTPIQSIGELPLHVLTASRPKDMTLIFQVTLGEWVKELRVGDFTIGTCNVEVISKSR
ncbi:MAG: CvpA family protein [Planctomycetes bacterium]|nr:CvpA family protein [Planctomycetota bacterium]